MILNIPIIKINSLNKIIENFVNHNYLNYYFVIFNRELCLLLKYTDNKHAHYLSFLL